jgi:serine/threonine protein kinase
MLELTGYEVGSQLYRSAASVVYRAKRRSDGRPVVLKVLGEDYPSPERIARFKREFEMAQKLKHDATVEALELLRAGRRWIMVLEDFGGESLRDLGLFGRLDLRAFLDFAIALARAVEAIHQRRIIHKDITPGKISSVVNPPAGFPTSSEIVGDNQQIRRAQFRW